MEPLPLIVAGYKDPHVEAVLAHFKKSGVVPIIVNRASLPQQNLTICDDEVCIGDYRINAITSIWYRRSLPLIFPEDMEEKWAQWGEQEFSSAFLAALYQCDALWVNDPFQNRYASLKPLQLKMASSAGFCVPEYIVTSSPDEARSFAETQGLEETVIKPLGRPIVGNYRIGPSVIFTNTCSTIGENDWESIRFSPSILQRRIHRKSEVRVTIVGDDVFAAEIDVSFIDNIVDYRTEDPYKLPHHVIYLSQDFRSKCHDLMKFFGLHFAAFDFLKGEDDVLYFTEINPNGQWLWIEELTGLQISSSIASLLVRK